MSIEQIAGTGRGRWFLVLASSLIIWAGWPVSPFTFLLWIGFVPLFIVEHHYYKNPVRRGYFKFTGLLYISFLIWNVSTTWWVYNASLVGAIGAFVINSFLMTIPWQLFWITKRKAGPAWGYFGLVLYWISFEHIHLNWDLSWPWLNLGNGLSQYPQWIQWYEYSGAFGGTLWILVLNLLVFFTWYNSGTIFEVFNRKFKYIILGTVVGIPLLTSYLMYFSYEEKGEEIEIVVLQPNIDPYTEKFAGSENFIPFERQLERFMSLSEKMITEDTDFVVWPETALDDQYYEPTLTRNNIIRKIFGFRQTHPQISLVTGLTTYTTYEDESQATETSRYHERLGYYDVFNTACFIDDNGAYELYHKSKLVPGVEIMPYPAVLNILTELVFNLGGTTGGYGRQKERTVFFNSDEVGVAPSICYESVYGDFMSQYTRNGANLIFIITNDGWWGDTPGHKQHMQYAVMRAIETRRSIARSANTGISGFINQRGDILQATEYWTQEVISGKLRSNEELTFYAVNGDVISRTAAWLSVFVLLAAIVKGITRKQ